MNKQTLSFEQTGYFSKLITDYLAGNKKLNPFINQPFNLDAFKTLIQQRKETKTDRNTLVQALENQYKNIATSDFTKTNIQQLKNENCFTITTGHQLNLFTGPLYFIYKIISVINLAKELKRAYPENDFVPVYWMATEDHDFEEVNHFSLLGNKINISKTQDGAVGRMKLTNVDDVLQEIKTALEGRNGAEQIIELFQQFYTSDKTFTEAIRALVNHLFDKYGLVIIDGDDATLKQTMFPYFENELVYQKNASFVEKTSHLLTELSYKTQLTPREINLFYLDNQIRERIVFEENKYKVLNTKLEFSKAQILEELKNYPEKFSPNVVLRPLYQEVILPNLAYIGGGGELAYWFQLKAMFDANNVFFPMLVLRNSVLIVDGGSCKKISKLNLTMKQLFLETEELIKTYLKDNASISLDMNEEEKLVEGVFTKIGLKAFKVDASLEALVKAELQKSLKSLENIAARLVKAEKQKEDIAVNQIRGIKDKLFPNGSLQERQDNLSMLLLFYGEPFLDELLLHLNPLEKEFVVLYE
ncbi:MAG: bacillithiol biosynthesis cysteine-adding enzyme BshC [Bacteroidetes bacterium HGW-Bacteroidetes-12]|nr:MAG: bacillithiol biosynthesis cysteine-adding enzyme BshC [Bacteroidetes bacterium HGW-Bacteroidetes-12]